MFKDTVLFPEGGGQNDDHGWVDDGIPVLRVTRCAHLSNVKHYHGLESLLTYFLRQNWPPKFAHIQGKDVGSCEGFLI